MSNQPERGRISLIDRHLRIRNRRQRGGTCPARIRSAPRPVPPYPRKRLQLGQISTWSMGWNLEPESTTRLSLCNPSAGSKQGCWNPLFLAISVLVWDRNWRSNPEIRKSRSYNYTSCLRVRPRPFPRKLRCPYSTLQYLTRMTSVPKIRSASALSITKP